MICSASSPGRLTTIVAIVSLAGAAPAVAARTEPPPKALDGVGVTEHLGAELPLDLTFTDENGQDVRLGSYFDGKRPVILTLNYFECPMLCKLELNGLVEGLRGLSDTPGTDFRIVTVSFNPLETSALAKLKKENYVAGYGRPGAAEGWHFLTGKEPAIEALTGAVGFHYRYDEAQGQYAHPTAIMFTSGDGRVMRYLYGVEFQPSTLRLALAEAGKGQVTSTTEQIILYCFHYDANQGRYVIAATNVMRLGGVATALVLGVFLFTAWVRGARSRKTGSEQAPTQQSDPDLQ